MTNFEKIKRMSVDDFAEKMYFLAKCFCDSIDECRDCPFYSISCTTIRDIKLWLESEVSE